MHRLSLLACLLMVASCSSSGDADNNAGSGNAGSDDAGTASGSANGSNEAGSPVVPPAGGGAITDCPAFTPGADFKLCTGTYLTDIADDVAAGVAIGADGAVIYAGTLRADNYGKTPLTLLGGGNAGLLRLSPNGRSVLSVTRLGANLTGVDVRSGAIAIAGSFGVAVVDATAGKLVFQNDLGGAEGDAVAIGEDGTVAVTKGASVLTFDATGKALGTASFAMNRDIAHVAVDAASKTVIVTGFNQRDGGGCTQLQVPFIRGFGYDGTLKWTNYDFTHAEVAAVGECADSRGINVSIGRDGKLYYAGRSDGGNTVHSRMPRDLSKTAPNVSFDDYSTPFNMNGAASVAYVARFDAGSGALEIGQEYVVRASGKGNTMRANSVTATADGTVLVGGDSACCMPNAATQTVNGSPSMPNYAGGGFVMIIPKDFKSRLAWTVFRGATGDAEHTIGVATDGKAMTVLFSQLPAKSGAIGPLLTASPIQAAPGGGTADAWLGVWRAP